MRVLFYILYGIACLLSLLPMRVHYFLSDILYVILYHVVKYRREVVRKNLTSAFPEKQEEEIRRIEKGFYHFLCDLFAESVQQITISKENFKKRITFKNIDQLDQAINEGQSAALYLGHYCNWEWVTTLPLWVTPKAQCCQIYHPLQNKVFDQLFLRIRERFNSLCIPMQDSLRKVIEYHKAGQPIILGYISDQKPYWTNIHHWVDFLHHDTPVLTGAERIIRKMNDAVFYTDIRRVRRGYYEVTFRLITREPQKMEEFELTNIYYQMLEKSIQEAPEYWLWSHKRWSRTREKFNHDFEVVNGKVVHRKQ